jgi:hypothetical protein
MAVTVTDLSQSEIIAVSEIWYIFQVALKFVFSVLYSTF